MMLRLSHAGFRKAPRLAPLSDQLNPGELLAIVGPNGAGKSTLLSLLSGFRSPECGSVSLDDQPLSSWPAHALAARRALVAQRVTPGFDWPVRELVALGSAADSDGIETALEALDLLPLAERGALSLSGGESQRVMVARALCQLGQPGVSTQHGSNGQDGGLLLLDEPTSALDIGQQQRLMRLLRQLAETRHMAICCVLHDLNLASRFAHRVWLMDHGERIASGTPEEVLQEGRLATVFDAELESITSNNGGAPVLALVP